LTTFLTSSSFFIFCNPSEFHTYAGIRRGLASRS